MSSTTTSAAAAATTSGVPQVWIYPPGGEDVPTLRSTGNIGPVHLFDTMVLQWTPNTEPEVVWWCFSEGGGETSATLVSNEAQPVSYQFNQEANSVDDNDPVYCHLAFPNSNHGNTVTWQYFNNRSENAPVTYSAPAAVATSAANTASGIISTASLSTTVPTTSTSTASGQSQTATAAPASHNNGLSSGASAGIGIGVALAALLLGALLAVFLLRKRKARKAQAAQAPAWMNTKAQQPPFEPAPAYNSDYGHDRGNVVYAKHVQAHVSEQALPSELPYNVVHELSEQRQAQELPTMR
nr:hypothetical protein CFP56_21894 [Quercus suber]